MTTRMWPETCELNFIGLKMVKGQRRRDEVELSRGRSLWLEIFFRKIRKSWKFQWFSIKYFNKFKESKVYKIME